jgi:hypothetical protein
MNWTAIGSSGLPFARLAFAGTFLLATAGALIGMQPRTAPAATAHASVYQLVLRPDRGAYPREYFGSQWNDSPVIVNHDASDKSKVEFVRRWPMFDGCWWESTETLEPVSDTQYHYTYSDHQVSCPEDREEADEDGTVWVPSTRSGTVDVVALK